MSRYRTWMIVGCIIGSLAVALFIGLATHVFLANPDPSPRFTVLCLLNMLLGITSTCLLIGGKMCRWIGDDRDEFGKRNWWKGYTAAVEDLKTDADVLPMPLPAARNGRQG